MPVPSAPSRAALLALVLLAAALIHGGCAGAADEVGAEQINALFTAARTISFGTPKAVPLTIDGKTVTFTVTVGALGNITAVPVGPEHGVRQISIAVTTGPDGEPVPSSVTVISGHSEITSYRATLTNGTLTLVPGGPVTVPPPPERLVQYTNPFHPPEPHQDGGLDGGLGGGLSGFWFFLGRGPELYGNSDLVGGTPPPPPGAYSAGAGMIFAPGTSPLSQPVSPH